VPHLLLLGVLLAICPRATAQPVRTVDDELPIVRVTLGGAAVRSHDRDEIEHAIASKRWDDAARVLVAAIERAPHSPDLLTLLGRVFMAAGRPLNAAVAFKKAEALGPLDADTRFSLALAYIALGQGDWAQSELERLAASDPARVVYTYWLGRLDYDAGRYASAIARFQEVIAADATSVRAHDNLGLCYDAQHQPELAVASHRRAVELNSRADVRSPWPPLNLAVLLRQRGDLAESEALLRQAVEIDPGLAQAHYELGTVLERRGLPDAALASLRAAAAAAPGYAEPHYALARLHHRAGRAAEADAAMATFLRLRDAQVRGR
jgi:tetratricopeptide (TPR) repeat protein